MLPKQFFSDPFLRPAASLLTASVFLVLGTSLPGSGQTEHAEPRGALVWNTDAVQPRFVAAHGERAVIMGYGREGLEIWGYPFQLLSSLQVGFKTVGTASETDGQALLRRIEYTPSSITRVYIGPDYVVRETLFVPRQDPGAVISYEVQGPRPLEVGIHFIPVMNLMWPGAVGGQYTRWNGNLPGYVITEPEHGYTTAIASPNLATHDETGNPTVNPQKTVSFTLRTVPAGDRVSKASVSFLLFDPSTQDRVGAMHAFEASVDSKRQAAYQHEKDLERDSLQVITPDEETNRAIAWAEVALDQAWVCNPLLGCGLVAGYGPSRDARRPQYDWFFAGDGLLATNALISAGEYPRARQELEFIIKYQQPKTGMIWHEISQSAGLIDWAKYPYMYVHVDITADYLAAVARYVAVSGDSAFGSEHWPSILSAYQYVRGLVNASDGLPHIPQDKEGSDEQARPVDDLSLSAGVLAAEEGFAQLAEVNHHPDLARRAAAESKQLKSAIAAHYWNAAANFWIDGHTQNGAAIASRRKGPTALLSAEVFSPAQRDAVLAQLASADFQADWGVREVAISSPDYDPSSYGRGSITAPGTTQAAMTFWNEHHPAMGQEIWNGLLSWNTLDSLGHLHEVFAGDFFHEQTESVPEQTWSSAGVLDAAVRGLLGLDVRGVQNQVRFTPHLPAEWDRVQVGNVRLPHATLAFSLHRSMFAIDLEIRNEGETAQLTFSPQIPLGAERLTAQFQGHPVAVRMEAYPGDEHGTATLTVPPGVSRYHLQWQGGISLKVASPHVRLGDPSMNLKLTGVSFRNHTLNLEADVQPAGANTLELQTSCPLLKGTGVSTIPLSGGGYTLSFQAAAGATETSAYKHVSAELTFGECGESTAQAQNLP